MEKRLIIGLGQGEYRVSLELLMPKSKEILNKQNDGDTMEIGKKNHPNGRLSLVFQSLLQQGGQPPSLVFW